MARANRPTELIVLSGILGICALVLLAGAARADPRPVTLEAALEETDRIATAIDDVLRETPEVAAFTRRTGTELGPATATMQSRGDVMVRLVAPNRRDAISGVIAHVRDELHTRLPEARLEYVQVLQDVLNDLAGTPAPLEIKLLGEDRTGATLAGLLPLALGIGAGAELQRPLAIAVIGGLTLATGVTLVVTPGLTALVAQRRDSP
ncbi:MAG TPA: efflux RND transporter permease subunit [Kofleriaceae bacterium]